MGHALRCWHEAELSWWCKNERAVAFIPPVAFCDSVLASAGDSMRVLTYKRTHTGDPDKRGVFGSSDCMGSVRNRAFDVVIGVGSLKPDAGDEAIAGKVTWIGVGPVRSFGGGRGDQVSFERFLLLDGNGPDFASEAPTLSRRFYVNNARSISRSYSSQEKVELEHLIAKLLAHPECKPSLSAFVSFKTGSRRAKCVRICSRESVRS